MTGTVILTVSRLGGTCEGGRDKMAAEDRFDIDDCAYVTACCRPPAPTR